jgi:hypothetical protein
MGLAGFNRMRKRKQDSIKALGSGNFEEYSLIELRDMAKQKGIQGYSSASKSNLIKQLSLTEGD